MRDVGRGILDLGSTKKLSYQYCTLRTFELTGRTVNTFLLNSFRNNSFFAKKIRKEREVKEVFTFHILNFFPYQLSSQRLITATVNHSATCESLTLHLDCD